MFYDIFLLVKHIVVVLPSVSYRRVFHIRSVILSVWGIQRLHYQHREIAGVILVNHLEAFYISIQIFPTIVLFSVS